MLDGLQLLNFIKIQTDKCHINLTLTGNETRLLNKCSVQKTTRKSFSTSFNYYGRIKANLNGKLDEEFRNKNQLFQEVCRYLDQI